MKPKILYLTSARETCPGARFRALPFTRLGRERGLDVQLIQVPPSFLRRLAFFRFLPKADICIIQQELFSGRELAFLRKQYQTLVYDFDNVVWTLPEALLGDSRGQLRAHRRAERFMRQCTEVDMCIAGSISLARKAGTYQENVSVVPTGLDIDAYVPRHEENFGRPVQVGWMGTADDMPEVRMAFERLEALAGPIQFQVVSETPYQGPCEKYVFWEKWSAERELQQLHGMDVGLVPLADDEFSRGRCGVRLLQYMACGIPPIVSSVGTCCEIVDHGIDGFLVDDPSEWDKYVMHLIDDAGLRKTIGSASREKIRSRYEISLVGEQLWDVLDV